MDGLIRRSTEILQAIAAIWLIFVALTIFAEVAFRNLGLFLGADQIVQILRQERHGRDQH